MQNQSTCTSYQLESLQYLMNHSFHSKKSKNASFIQESLCPRTGGRHTRQCPRNCGTKKCRSIDYEGQQKSLLKIELSMEAAVMRIEKEQENSENSQIQTSNFLKPLNQSNDTQYLQANDIDEIMDEDINGHGIFSLLKIKGKLQEELQTNYALSNLTIVSYACKKCIKQDLETATMIARVNDDSQLGFIPMNSQIQMLIREKMLKDDQFGQNSKNLKMEQ